MRRHAVAARLHSLSPHLLLLGARLPRLCSDELDGRILIDISWKVIGPVGFIQEHLHDTPISRSDCAYLLICA
jgi:hypothetical protein